LQAWLAIATEPWARSVVPRILGRSNIAFWRRHQAVFASKAALRAEGLPSVRRSFYDPTLSRLFIRGGAIASVCEFDGSAMGACELPIVTVLELLSDGASGVPAEFGNVRRVVSGALGARQRLRALPP
jgi:hypothetical protein